MAAVAETPAVQKLIYLSLREIFVKESALFRKTKTVKKTIEQHIKKPQIQNLIQKGYDVDTIVKLAQALLEEQIFESTKKAKARFPDVFADSPTSVAALTSAAAPTPAAAPISTTAPTSTTAPQISGSKITTNGVASSDKNKKSESGKTDVQTIENKTQHQNVPDTPCPIASPDSTCLPFWYQHRILVRIQATLEKTCFNFALKNLSGALQENAWDCAEAVELNKWPKILLEHQHKLDQKSLEDVKKLLPSLLTSINQIRHAAVHRLRLPARSALDLIMDAEALAKLLQDDAGLEMISTIRQQVSVAIEDLDENKSLLESRLSEIRKEFAEKRLQLAREEAALIESAKEESKKRDFFANANPDDTLDATIAAQAIWKQKNSVSVSTDEIHGSEKTDEFDLGTEAAYDPVTPAEESAGPNGSFARLAEFQLKFDEESKCLIEGPNAYSHDDLDMICATSKEHREKPKVVSLFDQLEACLRTYTADELSKLNTIQLSPSTSECEYWATPWDFRSITEAALAVNGLEDSEKTSS